MGVSNVKPRIPCLHSSTRSLTSGFAFSAQTTELLACLAYHGPVCLDADRGLTVGDRLGGGQNGHAAVTNGRAARSGATQIVAGGLPALDALLANLSIDFISIVSTTPEPLCSLCSSV